MKRVVVTGMSAITSMGDDWQTFKRNIEAGNTGIARMDEWDRYLDLRTRLAGPVTHFVPPPHYNRKILRSMGRVAQMATTVTEQALTQAGLLDDPEIKSGAMGVSYGSSSGTPKAIGDFGNMLLNDKMEGINANTYIKMMAHTTPVNIGVHFGLKGRVITTSSACTSGSQGIGYAYEAIKYGMQTMMVAGGAEELDATQAAVFDTLFATSTANDTPELSPRPFDRDRDGLVIGEGAATLVLEELEHAKARGATILAEIVGFHCNSDGSHITQPQAETMQVTMEQSLADAGLGAEQIGYVSAHGTATDRGDVAESTATQHVFANKTPISSMKSYLGHSLGACGSIEAWLSLKMMQDNWFAATKNLENIDPACGDLDYIMGEARHIDTEYIMSNNFAFGGINTSLIFKRC
ncbi:beta-ketoacyl-ACP synthase [Oceanicoccus sp. KOV_DT_Chl]|uniref:beta-ketoacyl-ACP synthase n=1 Tax=Oceanicoccus sp. KOV_DT_Chl TaxID=1904639 RepID=UPI000C7AF10A|nr:beta-ketoacyl-ACP synthase [Oceanicoccus sp. KOV_DT_Chl]